MYMDFALEINRTEGGYRLDAKGAQGEAYRLDLPASQISFDLDGFLAGIGRPARSKLRETRRAGATPSDPRQTLKAFGTELFQTFFAGEIGLSFRRSRPAASRTFSVDLLNSFWAALARAYLSRRLRASLCRASVPCASRSRSKARS